MIAMQYSYPLPADYDMDIIRQRIASKGHLLDHFPKLIFKAYLCASKTADIAGSRENLYAPFYLWDGNEGMNNFLAGEAFAGLVQAFGWPSVKTWSVWQASLTADMAAARYAKYATREIVAIPAHAALGALRERETAEAQAAVASGGALAAVTAYEPTTWTLVRFRLWRDAGDSVQGEGIQGYEVHHMSLPGRHG
ncbi:MAG: DUF4865 family protein [Pseudomonadota bacterium]